MNVMNGGWYRRKYGGYRDMARVHYYRGDKTLAPICGHLYPDPISDLESAKPGDPACKLCKAKVEKGEIA